MDEHTEELYRRASRARKNPTRAEAKLRSALANEGLSYAFSFQKVFPPYYYVDAVALRARVIIELDGSSHNGRAEYDSRRASYLESKGFQVIRFTNTEVLKNPDDVVARIQEIAHIPVNRKGRRRHPSVATESATSWLVDRD